MAVKTQGTQLYIIDPDATGGPEILVVECAVSIDGLGAPREQIDTTCLEDQARSFVGGLMTPGTLTVQINADPSNASHVRLHELYAAGTTFDAAIGWADGIGIAPTLDTAGEFDFPTTRTWIAILDTYVADFPFSFAQNSVVSSSLTLQLSGIPTWVQKA